MAAKVRRRVLAAKVGVSVTFLSLLSGLGIKLGGDAAASGVAGTAQVRDNLIGSADVRNGSLRLRDFKAREVFPYKQGRVLRKDGAELKVSTMKLWSKIGDLTTSLGALDLKHQSFVEKLGLLELKAGDTNAATEKLTSDVEYLIIKLPALSDAIDARFDNVVSGRGSVLTSSLLVSEEPKSLAEIPGFGSITAGRSQGITVFRFTNTSGGTLSATTSDGAEVLGEKESISVAVDTGLATLQIMDASPAADQPAVVTATLSDMLTGDANTTTHQAVAQILIGL